MKNPIFACVALLALTSISALAADAGSPSLTVQVPGGDKLSIAVPAGWKQAVDKPPAGIPPTVDLTAPDGTLLKITFMPDTKRQYTKSDDLDKLVTKANQQYAGNSVEKRVVLQRLPSKAGPGVYSVFTDPKLVNVAKLPAGDFRQVSTGAISIGRQVLIFSLLSNNKDNDAYRQALDCLANGVAVASGG